MSSSSAASIPSRGSGLDGPEDKGYWEEYLRKVTDEDIRAITRWQKILDTLLVYVGLFIGVLTAFIIQASSALQPSPGDATNKILIAVYGHTMNASTLTHLEQSMKLDGAAIDSILFGIMLLCISLIISISVAAFALIVNLWLTQYHRSLAGTGSTIQQRIRERHETYTGLMEWKLPILIEILPMAALVALAFFAAFIRSLSNSDPITGFLVDIIFTSCALFCLLTASLAAFIKSAPFHSPLSRCIGFIFRIFPNRSIRGLIRIRTICVTLICVVSLITTFVYKLTGTKITPLMFLIPVCLLSLCQVERQAQALPKPRLFSLATWVICYSIVIIALFVGMTFAGPGGGRILFASVTVITLAVVIKVAQISHWTPDEGNAMSEAVAWVIKTQPSDNSMSFQKAVKIARNSAHSRSTLLKGILPVLSVQIKSIQGGREQDLKDEEKIYFTLLAVLVDFEPSKAVFWRNEAAVVRPILSDELKEKLWNLSKGGCTVHSSPTLSGCTKAEAEFILGKVGGEYALQKESVKESHRVV